MEIKVALNEVIEAIKAYIAAEVKQDMQAAELQAKFDALTAQNAELIPQVIELKGLLEQLKNSAPVTPTTPEAPVTPTEPTSEPPVVETPPTEPPAPIL